MILILVVSIFCLYLLHELYWKRRNFPPGPTPLPIFGNLSALTSPKPGYEAFVKWSKEFGNVFTFWLADRPFIMITSYDIMKETFIKDGDTYSDKLLNSGMTDENGFNYGVLDTNGEMWKEHRRFTLTQLRDLGLGKDLMQEKILNEIEELHTLLDESVGKQVNLPAILCRSVGNVINLTLFNERFDNKQLDEFAFLKRHIDGMIEIVSEFRYFIQHLIPWTTKVIPGPSLYEKSKKHRETLDKFFERKIEEHKKEIDFDQVESSDYVEAYLKEQRKRETDGDKQTFNNKQLMAMCFDLYMAGLLTTTMTLTWGVAYYLHHPEVKKKIQEELDAVVSSDRLISTADKNSLPYLSAFLNEVQRCANILPLNLLHTTTRDTVIGGFPVKRGTGVIAQISTVMLDENIFSEPYKFNPDRFIENGKLKKVEELVPFSIGKRQCLGEGLARMELFLLFANLFNRYDITTEVLPSMDKSQDNFVMVRKFDAELTKRHN